VVATGAAFFMIVLDTSIVNLALARIGTEFNSSLATWQWLVDACKASSSIVLQT
jgi:DHA2 family methylenomycin A resistance protein-like MFS transporter